MTILQLREMISLQDMIIFHSKQNFIIFAVCCPKNTYGPSCKQCPGETTRPCKENGKCDVSKKF